ncbi:hypothetical protein [Roseibacillus persicicus]|uniref:hypothetical protein n=1 Tax=Roseibacillus persicicus TaxID=454148 RepID=UPI00280D5EA6|nr:hypothetical protein [Roseibacillus persicicus]MDQ8190073.1 hypothetical protein [Roseibacillus persicicus]
MSEGSPSSGLSRAAEEYEFVKSGLPPLKWPSRGGKEVRGKEHEVFFRGKRVWKYQIGPALHPILQGKKLAVREALPTEYLARLTLQNQLFGDDLRVEGALSSGKIVTSQTTIKGGDPVEKEIEITLGDLGWQRIPTQFHSLPHNLMATAWIHPVERVVMVDARCPNFKKTVSGDVLAIDLMLAPANHEMLQLFVS